MSFDKNKAMRNAERFLSQGKIRAAINEYQRVVENDPKDFSTLNILGDLYAKTLEKQQAVGCFTQVAEHYNTQGFSHKAIAVYNKISRIEPSSIEVSAKLAELYQSKGSIAEARQHYKTLADHYQRKGQKIEALAIWKQIAELDPNNTEIYLTIAETCWQEEQFEEAARAFTEAGLRFIKQDKFEAAITAFTRSLEIKKDDLRTLKGLVKAQIGLGCADEAANLLEEILQTQPHNRDVLYLLVDCYLDMNNAAQAEHAVINLVEQEPANYLKFLDLVKIYLKSGDLTAATRILLMAAEHLLVGGQADEFLEWTNEILARNPEQVDALRLLVRYHDWQRNEADLKLSLERLAEAARLNEAVEDEKYALSQLLIAAPQNDAYISRLQQLGVEYDAETVFAADQNGSHEFGATIENSPYQNFEISEELESPDQSAKLDEFSFADVKGPYNFEANGAHSAENDRTGAVTDFAFYNGAVEAAVVENAFETHNQNYAEKTNGQTTNRTNDDLRLQKELDSIEYYIEQGYQDLAAKSLNELEAEFGARPELALIRGKLNGSALPAAQTFAEPEKSSFPETVYTPENEYVAPSAPIYQEPATTAAANGFDMRDELIAEFDAENEPAADIEEDYETHYHLATAYKEMGLLENAIREFQDAINLVETNDGTRRFFQCANNLGHCFMEKQMPKAAANWFLRDLEINDITDEEKQAIFYDLGDAYEASGETDKAVAYFEQLYAENVDYRDVGERLGNLQRG